MSVPDEPSDEMIRAYCQATGFTPSWTRTVMASVQENRGTSSEPGVICSLRGVLMFLKGVPLEEIGRGGKRIKPKAKKP